MLTIAKSDTLIQVLPASLRFWKKLGLGPRAGRKDVNAFILYEGSEEAKEEQFAKWLDRVSKAYTVSYFGLSLAFGQF